MATNHNNQPNPIPPPPGAIRVDPDSTPLEQLGVPMDDVKDLLALQGAGSFSRQVKVGVRKQAADAAGCLLIGGVIVAALLIGFVLLVCSYSANRYTGLVEDSAKLTAESPRIAAAFDLLIFDIKSKYSWGSEGRLQHGRSDPIVFRPNSGRGS
jgi:hypothetical protein